MSVKIRLRRMGAKKQPCYRLVVADSRSPRDGRFLDEIGYYNPTTEPATLQVQEEKALEWMRRGAQPSDTVRALLSEKGLLKKLDEERRARAAARKQAGA